MVIINNEGFSIQFKNGIDSHHWEEIETIFGYKKDLITYDEICMDIFLQDQHVITLTEELPNWIALNEKLTILFPGFDLSWYTSIMQPPFATNLTLLYDRQQRSFEVAVSSFYGPNRNP